jgi:hypothetical protein
MYRAVRGHETPSYPLRGWAALSPILLPSFHSNFQDSATPERNRFFESRTPSGEMAMVKVSPSISTSRRIVFSSLVGMSGYYPTATMRCSALQRLDGFRGKDVIDVPVPLLLKNLNGSDKLGGHQHVVRRLKNALKM